MEHRGYDDISSSEMDSRLASPWPSMMSFDDLERLERAYLARVTLGYPLLMRIQNGVLEYLDEHGAVTRVEYDDDPYGGGRFGAVPASEVEIARLPAAIASEVKGKDCAVCIESFKEGETLTVRKMKCPSSHPFHENCIFKWLRVSRLCPLCRFAMPAEQEEDGDEEAEEEV
ncbi:unnamed protein product [Alopecurus aequalis]